MRLVVSKEFVRGILRWTQRSFGLCALTLLGYSLFVVADAWLFERQENLELYRLAEHHAPAANAPKGLIGRLAIRRLDLSVIVMEGSTADILRRSAGHIAGTGLPGAPGNIGISAHRDTFFLPLRNIRQNDIITLTTPVNEFRYRVLFFRIVSPSDVAVLEPTTTEVLTLVTCYPFYFVGSAPDRFIVRAERII